MNPAEIIQAAREHHQAGRLHEAETLYRQVLATYPQHPDALYYLGLIAFRLNKNDAAAHLVTRAINAHPTAPGYFYHSLGHIFLAMNLNHESLSSFDEALRRQPNNADTHAKKGVILRRLGRDKEAITSYVRALQLDPNMASIHYNLGNAYRDCGDVLQAIACFEKALELFAQLKDQTSERTLIAATHNNLGQVLADIAYYPSALEHFQKSIALMPDSGETYHNCANVLRNQGKLDDCLACYAQALAIKPEYAEARWAYAIAHIPLLFQDVAEIIPSRLAFETQLDELDHWFNAERISLGHMAVGVSQPFFLAYQEINNRDMLSKYGMLCARLMKDWWDRQNFPPLPPRSGDLIKLGIVSSHFHNHSVWHALIRGWLRHFDRAKFEIHLFATDFQTDDETQWAIKNVTSFQRLGMDVLSAVQAVRSKNLDVLIYPEIGMASTALRLACLRLCPVQMTSWGHPETSGLPTMDYYLSAEDFEPPEADAYYSEKLIRLPHLGCSYQSLAVTPTPPDLQQLGLNAHVPLLLAPGAPYKYTPQHDRVFVEIARTLKKCQIVFFTGRLDNLSNYLRMRLSAAFQREGLDFDTTCIFIPWQERSAFYGLMERATVFLDTIGFSGFNTAVQAVECGLPIVTREGQFMRGRLGSGILRRMGLPELIAKDDDDYVTKAVKLAQDAPYHATIKQRMITLREGLFNDQEPVKALEQLLIRLTKRSP